MWETGHPARFATASKIATRATPAIGEHTVPILKELGRSDAEVQKLLDQKAVRAYKAKAPVG